MIDLKLDSNPDNWTWRYDYDTYHLGAVVGEIQAHGDTFAIEIPFNGLTKSVSELTARGYPNMIIGHATMLYRDGVSKNLLGTPHKPSWER